MVVGELDRLTVGKKFDVDVAGSKERGTAANEGEHAAVGGECRVNGGVGEERELLPFLFGGGSFRGGMCAEVDRQASRDEDKGSRAGNEQQPGTPRRGSRSG